MSASYDCEIIFPSHEEVDESWARRAIGAARYHFLRDHGLISTNNSRLVTRVREFGRRFEQWSYKCEVRQ